MRGGSLFKRARCRSALSRTAARAKVTERDLRRQMEGIWYDYRMADKLRDEAPSAYKDVRAVLRAQRELVKVTEIFGRYSTTRALDARANLGQLQAG